MRVAIAFLAALACAVPAAAAETWPSRAVRIVVPFPPGGITDVLARHVAEGLRVQLGQPVVIDNRPGASGTIGAAYVARSAADCYTLLFGARSTFSAAPAIYERLPYDPARDFTAVARVASVSSVVVVHPSVGIGSIEVLRQTALREPGRLTFGSAGPGTSQHIGGELFNLLAGTRMTHVPYRGGAPAMNDLVGGHIDLMFEPVPTALVHIRSGALVALATTTPVRARALPDLPTIAETGLPGYDLTWWFGLAAPAKLPARVLDRLAAALRSAMQSPGMRDALVGMGADPMDDSPAEFARAIRADIEEWGALVRRTGARAD
jgi:tripartite-type tricarboxylate transporter receptor subunit TctC